ncbi:hypothetical protein PAXRUDRAFT_824273 [Paxillus rubicundulus Ve08.2h10]|uniref:Uncharacterized protein n=1 Tax=Paxillus rubicundulus Ve08.2h10 TaxID=930991 RepID=A0A0D0DUM4_9AGAM|nr:hypothetical protein PAXRUDRAFT_824273 [Paxillus rubicundulus Ve08.2h10]
MSSMHSRPFRDLPTGKQGIQGMHCVLHGHTWNLEGARRSLAESGISQTVASSQVNVEVNIGAISSGVATCVCKYTFARILGLRPEPESDLMGTTLIDKNNGHG